MGNYKFYPESFPLRGCRLIEASAGTGKTYQIANLYLRLIIGDDCEPKTVDQILVVTFTRAATDELRGRIREKIDLALQIFRGFACEDIFINSLLDKVKDKKESARRLNYALLRMDEACIFTIHGFAVRAMQTFLFETGALANVELTEGNNYRKEMILADLWRQLQLTHDTKLKSYVDAAGFSDKTSFVKYFENIPANAEITPSFKISDKTAVLERYIPALDAVVNQSISRIFEDRILLRKRWSLVREDFISNVGAGKSGLSEGELNELLSCIDSWLVSKNTQVFIPPRSRRPYNKLNPVANGEGEVAKVLSDILRHVEESLPLSAFQDRPFRALLLKYIRVQMMQIDLSSMQLDDVIALINSALQEGGKKAAQLRSIITRHYPVCMVDEFQDTDPQQFMMFNQLYGNNESTGFFMIGDPKQSIYSFRGADIFSYLAVKENITRQQQIENTPYVFSLDTNFRSKQALVEATNALFREMDENASGDGNYHKTFLFHGISYMEIKSCEGEEHKKDKGTYKPGYEQLPVQPLVFIGNDADINNKGRWAADSLRWKYAHDAAQRIALLLDENNPATIKTVDKPERPLRGGDIAVLVRNAREASIMRDTLLAQAPRIASVYQSQRDSVFSCSLISEDIYYLLCAMDNPKDKGLLKSAMVTLLYRGFSANFDDLDTMETEDVFFEKIISEFSGYQDCWDRYGVLTAIDRFVSRHQLMPKIALLPDGDRLVTDLRHLGELLQKKQMECSSREELLNWYRQQLLDDSELEEDAKRIRLESDENLVKIVTIHVSKGLEYPLVFLPFFFLPWKADAEKKLPLYHPEPKYQPYVDFSSATDVMTRAMEKERLAEDMRLLYVAMTRAIYQCCIGISAAVQGKQRGIPLFPATVWNHLLEIKNDDPMPDWMNIKGALQKKMQNKKLSVAYQTLFDLQHLLSGKNTVEKKPVPEVSSLSLMASPDLPPLRPSHWVITSYTALAQQRKDPGVKLGGVDELPMEAVDTFDGMPTERDSEWTGNIRYRLQSSGNTGECLHGFFEQLAQDPSLQLSNESLHRVLQDSLRRYGLDKPEGLDIGRLTEDRKEAAYHERRQQIIEWLESILRYPLIDKQADSSLRQLFLNRYTLPELDFDFSLGAPGYPVKIMDDINRILGQLDVAGISGNTLEGLMTGAIDLLFIHQQKVYLLDYKSNLIGKSPSCYNPDLLSQAMKNHRYDLQYLIYSVAVHRYMQQRLQKRYAYDGGEFSFGGVFYLFLRGMGFAEYRDCGVWFHRPDASHIHALDVAFRGGLENPKVNHA